MPDIIHFQEKLQHAICVNRRLTSTTFNRSEVTCRSCLEKLRLQARGPVDWEGIYADVKEMLPAAQLKVKEFCFAHPRVQGKIELENGPPRITLNFWFPAPKGNRRKTVGHNIGSRSESNIIQILIPNEHEMDEVATFIGQLSDELKLMPRRDPARRDGVVLAYELRPKYGRW